MPGDSLVGGVGFIRVPVGGGAAATIVSLGALERR
jgi:hypothetical protein